MAEESYKDKSIIITGASSGIGEQLALALAREGAKLALAARSTKALERVAEACCEAGGEAVAIQTDVGEQEACAALIAETVERFGGVDVLVNNAGFSMVSRLEDVEDISVFDRLIRVNYLGAVYCTHAALPHLLARKGQVVAVSSLTGKTGVPTRSGYSASKHAMQGFFDSIRIELDKRVDVLVVSPGFVDTTIRSRAVGADGQARGAQDEPDTGAMTVDYVVAEMLAAMRKRDRDLILPKRMRAGIIAKALAPGIIDRIAARAVKDRGG